tara:strand:+ start:2679 stop:2819 length:141 start_codon:yes stop_codon:yes gene_type:complete
LFYGFLKNTKINIVAYFINKKGAVLNRPLLELTIKLTNNYIISVLI